MFRATSANFRGEGKIFFETLSVSDSEEKILTQSIGQTLILVSTEDSLIFDRNFIWTMYCDLEEIYIKIEREDIVAKLFDQVEDGGKFKISKAQHKKEHKTSTKTINRVVQDVLIVETEIVFSNYRINYPKAIIFRFSDCNLVIEKAWIFSLAGFIVRLESLDDDTFGFADEISFWYDPELDEEKPLATQRVKSLLADEIVSVTEW